MSCMTSITSAGTLASKVFLSPEARALATKYLDDFVKLCMKKETQKLLTVGGIATTAASLGTSALSAAQGKATGGFTDLGGGVLDLQQDEFREDGAAESGSLMADAGKIIQNCGMTAFSIVVEGAKLSGKLSPARVELLKKVTKGLMLWQGATLADEFVRPDHNGIGDTVDTVAGGLSVMSLARTLGTLAA